MKAPVLVLLFALALLVAPGSALAAPAADTLRPFDIGVPAGDAYAPNSLALDPARDLAYVYHSTVADGAAAISVVDLESGRVDRVLRGPAKEYGGPGRLLLTPDGRQLLLQEAGPNTLSMIDTQTGATRKLLGAARDVALSEDGKLVFVAGEKALAAYPLAGLLEGKKGPAWQSAASYNRLVVNDGRLLAAAYGMERPLVAFDARTGTQLATTPMPSDWSALSAGPDGGWGLVVAGESPRLIRFDAALKPVGETEIPYAARLSYDAAANRFLVGGYRYDEREPQGYGALLAIGGDGQVVAEARWPGLNPPTDFTAWDGGLLAFAADGPSVLFALDPATFELRAEMAMGVRVMEAVAAGAAVSGGGMLYVADDLGRIHGLGLPQGEEVALWQGSSPLALDAENGRLYANRNNRVVALDLDDGSVLAEFPQGGHPAPDSTRDLVYIAGRGVTMYDRSGRKLGDLPSTFPDPKGFSPNPYAYAAEVNPVTGHVAVVLHNGIPGSNGGSFLRIYEPQSDKFVAPPAPHSFVMDVMSDSKGTWYVAYSPARNEAAIQALSPDGKELRRLDHRSGFLALDERRDNLYLFSEGNVTRLAASTLTALEVLQGPRAVAGLASEPGGSGVYLVDRAGPLVTALQLPDLVPAQSRPVPARLPADAPNDSLSVAGEGRERLVIARFGDPYRSDDGDSWQRLLPGAGMTYSYVTLLPPETVFVTGVGPSGGAGVWRSRDGGDTWEWLAGGLTDLLPAGPVLARGPDEAYFFTRGQGLYRWDPAGRKWDLASAMASGSDWSALALAPDGTLFRTNTGFLESSGDRGSTWTRLGSSRQTGDAIGFSSLYTVTHTVFSAVRSDSRISGIQRSEDEGKTWQPAISAEQVDLDGDLELVSGFGGTYLLVRPYSGEPSLLRTTDFGDTWQLAPAGIARRSQHVAVDPLDGRLWLGVKGGVRIVDPGRLRWQPLERPRAMATAPAAGPCETPLAPEEAEINARALGLGCPAGQSATVQMARQRFERGLMIWRADKRLIYVLSDEGTWAGYEDLWKEGDPADDPALAAPAGFQQPARGFGKVWREKLGGPDAQVGWALEKERGMEGQAQEWDHGLVLRFGGEVIILQSTGKWR